MSSPTNSPGIVLAPLAGAPADAAHVAIYLRVSTDEQDVAHQRAECYSTAERAFPGRPTVEYVDQGVSASKHDMIDREAARAMLAAIDSGEVVGVVTWKQDRLSRRGGVEIAMFLERCHSQNVRVSERDGGRAGPR